MTGSSATRVQLPQPRAPELAEPRARRVVWAEVGVVLLVAAGVLAVDLAVAMSLGAPLGIMGVALVRRGLLLLADL
jgi:uncharacterized membrane protein